MKLRINSILSAGLAITLIPAIICSILLIANSPFQNTEGYTLDAYGSNWFYSLYTKPYSYYQGGNIGLKESIKVINTVPMIMCIIVIVIFSIFCVASIVSAFKHKI